MSSTVRHATTPFADLIGETHVIHLRGSEVHTLLDSLRGVHNACDAKSAVELTRTLVGALGLDQDIADHCAIVVAAQHGEPATA